MRRSFCLVGDVSWAHGSMTSMAHQSALVPAASDAACRGCRNREKGRAIEWWGPTNLRSSDSTGFGELRNHWKRDHSRSSIVSGGLHSTPKLPANQIICNQFQQTDSRDNANGGKNRTIQFNAGTRIDCLIVHTANFSGLFLALLRRPGHAARFRSSKYRHK